MTDCFLEDAFWFCPTSFVYCSEVWCSAADTHHKLLDLVVSDASFLTMVVFKCDLVHVGLWQYYV